MTAKKDKTTEVRVDDDWVDVSDDVVEPESVSIDGLSADAALLMLRALRKTGGPVILTATTARATDQVVVDAHAFGGQRVNGGWQFDAKSLDMACRVAGWSRVERDGNTWRLS